MQKIGNIFEEVLFDKKIEEENKENSLKSFYMVDIRVTRGGDEEKKTEGTSYVQRTEGEVVVPEDKVQNIQNLHNLVDYMSGLVENGQPLVNSLVSEVIKTAADNGSDSLQDLVQEEDKIIIDVDYGFEKQDSIGIKLNKTSGSDLVTFSMKKDGNIIPGTFNMEIFEQQILSIRKRFMEKE